MTERSKHTEGHQDGVRATILERRRLFVKAALAGLSATAVATCISQAEACLLCPESGCNTSSTSSGTGGEGGVAGGGASGGSGGQAGASEGGAGGETGGAGGQAGSGGPGGAGGTG